MQIENLTPETVARIEDISGRSIPELKRRMGDRFDEYVSDFLFLDGEQWDENVIRER